MTKDFHIPVLLNESLEGLQIKPAGIYVDVTFGGGGHSSEILKHLGNDGKLFAFDQDKDAQANSLKDDRFTLIPQNFEFNENYLELYQALPVDGILADLGVSSHQFDTGSRGFSTRFDGPLDMRMSDSNELTAYKIINEYEEAKLISIFREYGELRNAPAVASRVVYSRIQKPIENTADLKKITAKFAKAGKENKFFAQLFQALRLEVNQELEVLKKFLESTLRTIREGGRLVVITYHSLEDRIVKNFMKTGKFEGELEKDFYGNPIRPFKQVFTKPITPSKGELSANPRSRSAKLRVAEKILS